MIAISEGLIRHTSARRQSAPLEEDTLISNDIIQNEGETIVASLLSSSPIQGEENKIIIPQKNEKSTDAFGFEEETLDSIASTSSDNNGASSTRIVRFDSDSASPHSQKSPRPNNTDFTKEAVASSRTPVASSLSSQLDGVLRAARGISIGGPSIASPSGTGGVGPVTTTTAVTPGVSGLTSALQSTGRQSNDSSQLTAQLASQPHHLVLSVFTMVDAPPMRVVVTSKQCTVHHLIENIIQQYRTERLQPHLTYHVADAYELRMLDDDDGYPDEDFPPLDRHRDIHEYGIDSLALVENPSYEGSSHRRSHSNSDSSNTSSSSISTSISTGTTSQRNSTDSGRILLKVHVFDEMTHVFAVASTTSLEELLPQIAKKTRQAPNALQPEHLKFQYLSNLISPTTPPTPSNLSSIDEIDMKTMIRDLKPNQELKLSLKNAFSTLASATYNSSQMIVMEPIQDTLGGKQFAFTIDTAGQYCEYKVIKVNQRGKKQHRVFGIDRTKIYNKHHPQHKFSMGFEVFRAQRPISSITDICINGLHPTTFQITYKEKGKSLVREYTAETKMECAEIVAKIRFLMQHQE